MNFKKWKASRQLAFLQVDFNELHLQSGKNCYKVKGVWLFIFKFCWHFTKITLMVEIIQNLLENDQSQFKEVAL